MIFCLVAIEFHETAWLSALFFKERSQMGSIESFKRLSGVLLNDGRGIYGKAFVAPPGLPHKTALLTFKPSC
jgi:hypothetical protein